MRIIILALLVIGAACMGSSDNISDDNSESQSPPQNKSVIIFNAVEKKGIDVKNVYTSNGSEIKKAFGLEDSHIGDDSLIAFIIFRYSTPEGIDKKLVLVLNTIYTTLSAEPFIDGVLVMPYDPSIWTGRVSLIYTNRSYAEEVAAQNLPVSKFYNSFDVYMITDQNED